MSRKSSKDDVQALVRALKKTSMTGKGAYKPRSATGSSKKVRGRGFYKGFGKDLGSAIGNLVSKGTGIPGLGAIGEKLGGYGAKMTGWGSYTVRHNSLVAQVPQISNPRKEGSTQIRFREFIGDVKGSVDFNVQYNLDLNAALSTTFPWMSQIAQNFTQFEINGMLFEYVSTSGDSTGGDTSLGTVIMSTNYDAILPTFSSKNQMLNQQFATTTKPSLNSIHAIECANAQTTIPLLYTRTGAVPANADQRLYDLGTFYLATQGNQNSTSTLGELWVTYDVLLYKPLLSGPEAGRSVNPATKVAINNALWQPGGGSASANNGMWGEVAFKYNSLGLEAASVTNSQSYFKINDPGLMTLKFDFTYNIPDYIKDYFSCYPTNIVNGSLVNTVYVDHSGNPVDQFEQIYNTGTNTPAIPNTYILSFIIKCNGLGPLSFNLDIGHAPDYTNGNWKNGVLIVSAVEEEIV